MLLEACIKTSRAIKADLIKCILLHVAEELYGSTSRIVHCNIAFANILALPSAVL